jgi:acylphosphatase
MNIARRVRVTGLVQGVYFRGWAKEQAEDLGLHGWVRNCPDGSVEAHVEGEEARLAELIARLKTGPPAAEVENVDVRDAEPEGFHHFTVARSM